MRLSDSIEQFIKDLLKEESTEVELKRNELAEYFGCAPSQINYVLATISFICYQIFCYKFLE